MPPDTLRFAVVPAAVARSYWAKVVTWYVPEFRMYAPGFDAGCTAFAVATLRRYRVAVDVGVYVVIAFCAAA